MENIQKIRKKYPGAISIAMVYYAAIAGLNKIRLTTKEIELLGFLGVTKENFKKSEFILMFGSSEIKVNNIINSLRKKGLLTKQSKPIQLQEFLTRLDFSKNITLNILLEHETN